MDYVNAPVGKGRAPGEAARAAGRRADHDRHRQREHHGLRARRARAAGEDRDQPPAAAADPGGRRPAAHADPAGRGDRRRGHGHPLPRAGELDRAAVTTPTTRKPPEQRVPYCGANPIADMWSEKAMTPAGDVVPDRGAPRRRRATPASEMALAATFAGHGLRQRRRAHPARQRLPDRRPGPGLPPRGLPRRRADGAARHGGVADRARGVPVHLRGRPGAAPARGRAARPAAPTGPTTCATSCRRCSPT